MTTNEQHDLENEVGDMICNHTELIDRIRNGETELEQEKEELLTKLINKLDDLGYQFKNRDHAEIWIMGGSALLKH